MSSRPRLDLPRKALGARLRALRDAAGLTSRACYEHLGVAQNTWDSWLSGEREPKATQLVAIADLLGCSVDFLLRPEESERVWLVDRQLVTYLQTRAAKRDSQWEDTYAFGVDSHYVRMDETEVRQLQHGLQQRRESL